MMQAFCSHSLGICVFEPESTNRRVIDAVRGTEVLAHLVPPLISSVDDWIQVKATGEEEVLSVTLLEHRTRKTRLYVEASLLDLTDGARGEVLEEVEKCLQIGVQPKRVLSLMLVAPLRDDLPTERCAQLALVNGLAATGALLEELHALQPHISRISATWLELDELEFSGYPGGKCGIWADASESGVLHSLASSSNRASFTTAWNALAWHYEKPHHRTIVTRAGAELGKRVFPAGELSTAPAAKSTQRQRDSTVSWRNEVTRPGHVEFESVKKQIDAIVALIAKGKDPLALKYLDELVSRQAIELSQPDLAVKSICNIAQQSAEIFRTDFERKCLALALQTAPNDAWATVQLGDHYKRTGQFQLAISTFQDALRRGSGPIALSSIADVYASQGDFEKAIASYAEIKNRQSDPVLRMAVADNLRKMGEFERAESEYRELLTEGTSTNRAYSGLAEIEKRKGRLGRAIQYYKTILNSLSEDHDDAKFYAYSLAKTLKQNGQIKDSLVIADRLTTAKPYWMQARILKASLLGLLGRTEDALKMLPDHGAPKAFGEWTEQYTRGAILLLLDRFAPAREGLLNTLESHLADGDGPYLLRLGAIVAFLAHDHQFSRASELLNSLPKTTDLHLKYLSHVLEYHIATAQNDERNRDRIAKLLQSAPPSDGPLLDAIKMIERRMLKEATKFETVALLRLAAA